MCAHVAAYLFFPLLCFRADVFILRLQPGLARGPSAASAELTLAAPEMRGWGRVKGKGRRGGGTRSAAGRGSLTLPGLHLPSSAALEQHPPTPISKNGQRGCGRASLPHDWARKFPGVGLHGLGIL